MYSSGRASVEVLKGWIAQVEERAANEASAVLTRLDWEADHERKESAETHNNDEGTVARMLLRAAQGDPWQPTTSIEATRDLLQAWTRFEAAAAARDDRRQKIERPTAKPASAWLLPANETCERLFLYDGPPVEQQPRACGLSSSLTEVEPRWRPPRPEPQPQAPVRRRVQQPSVESVAVVEATTAPTREKCPAETKAQEVPVDQPTNRAVETLRPAPRTSRPARPNAAALTKKKTIAVDAAAGVVMDKGRPVARNARDGRMTSVKSAPIAHLAMRARTVAPGPELQATKTASNASIRRVEKATQSSVSLESMPATKQKDESSPAEDEARSTSEKLEARAAVWSRARVNKQLRFILRIWQSWASFSSRRLVEASARARRFGFRRSAGRAFGAWARVSSAAAKGMRAFRASTKRRRLQRTFAAWNIVVLRAARLASEAEADWRWRRQRRVWASWARAVRAAKSEREAAQRTRDLQAERRKDLQATRWRERRLQSSAFLGWLSAAASSREEREIRAQHAERRRKVEALESRIAAQQQQQRRAEDRPCRSRRPDPRPDPFDVRARERRERRALVATRTRNRLESRRDAARVARQRREEEEAAEQLRARDRARAASLAARELARHQHKVARLHYDRACLRWRGLIPWHQLVATCRLERTRAERWFADGLAQRAMSAWLEWRKRRRERILRVRQEAILAAVRVAERYRCRIPLARWVSAAQDVAVLGAAVASKHRVLLASRLLGGWRRRATEAAAETTVKWQDAVASDRRATKRRVLKAWLKKLDLWRQGAFLELRRDQKWGKVRGWLGVDTIVDSTLA